MVGTAEDSLDLVGNVSREGATLVNYFYLADGTKTRALDGSGEGLVYRGPFVYRKGSGSSSLTLESASFGGGRLTPDGALLYMTDYLGSVRAVVDGTTGQIYKAVDYSAYGYESEVMVPQQGSTPEHTLAAATLPSGMTLRDSFTGQEDQTPDFGTSYTDFGARQYSPALRRWMTPDPLSEKYYGVSPYAFCNNNPVNFVDPDGEDGIYINFPEYRIDIGIQVPFLGHSGVLLIDNKTGLTKYYEYGRYDSQNLGIVLNRAIPNVDMGKDGKPTEESLYNVLKYISHIAGHDGPIEGAYVESDEFDAMNNYAQSRIDRNVDIGRESYNIFENNCSTFAEEVLKQDKNVEDQIPASIINVPNRIVKKWQKVFTPIKYEP